MTLKKGVLILALLTASDFMFTGCSYNSIEKLEEKEQKEQKIIDQVKQNQILISEYDPIMRELARSEGLDWRFIAAISYQESRFKNDVTSPVGAIGIMQIMPSTARSFGLTTEEVRNPQVNVATAVGLIKRIEKSMRFSTSMSQDNKLRIILACYNGGIGHVTDALRLAQKYGADHTDWNQLAKYLQYKSLPEYANDAVVKCGSFRSGETLNFVKVVMEKYQNYCKEFPV